MKLRVSSDARSPLAQSGSEGSPSARWARLHLRFGWWALLVFATLGLVLEALHGFKVGWYLNVSSQTRRSMWTLAHAHGTLLAMIHIGFALTLTRLRGSPRGLADASRLLRAAAVLLPMGFFIGGVFIHDGDPGLGIVLVPIGGVVLLLGVLLTARATDSGAVAARVSDVEPKANEKAKRSTQRPRR